MAKYRSSQFSHTQQDKIGVLLTNLGTPNAPTAKALRPYLKQFLSDPRVVEIPRLIWWFILNGIILRIRPRRSAKAYRTVWTDEGSPLAVHTRKQHEKVSDQLKKQWGDNLVVRWAMRYGEPSIPDALQELADLGVRKLLVLPLYPQYSAATTGSTFDAVAHDFIQRRWLPELRFINQYVDFPPYVDAIANSIEEYWRENVRPQKLIFSYHGVPLRYLHNGDPYHCQCHKTTRLIAEKLGLRADEYMTTFQSRFGREAWLKPYTDHTLQSLPEQGVTSVHVICPGFSSDCLETIEEIDEENRAYFLEAGGEHFSYIPALNSSSGHITMLSSLIETNLRGWIPSNEDLSARSERADNIKSAKPEFY